MRKTTILFIAVLAGCMTARSQDTHATQDPYARLTNSEKGVVRMAVRELGRSKYPDAASKLIDLYQNGETYDWWGHHIKIQILISLRQLESTNALELCSSELSHTNKVIAENAVKTLVAVVGDGDRKEAAQALLATARANQDPDKVYSFVWGLGQLKAREAVSYITSVYRKQNIPSHLTSDYVVAGALADIGKAECLPVLMEIYLASPALAEMTCLDGEAIEPCLRGLKTISGQDFGDNRKAWQKWYSDHISARDKTAETQQPPERDK
jgi:hypothetical protein